MVLRTRNENSAAGSELSSEAWGMNGLRAVIRISAGKPGWQKSISAMGNRPVKVVSEKCGAPASDQCPAPKP